MTNGEVAQRKMFFVIRALSLLRHWSFIIHHSSLLQVLRQHQFRPAAAQDIVDAIKRVADQVQPEPARLDQINSPALQRIGWRLFSVIAQAQANAVVFFFEREGNKLVVAPVVSVADDVCASFVHAEDHERTLTLG